MEPLTGVVILVPRGMCFRKETHFIGIGTTNTVMRPFLISVLSLLYASGKDFIMYFDQKVFGERIQQLRIAEGMTQEGLAEKASTERSHIAKIESGKRSCSIDLLIVFSDIFDVTTDYLLLGKSGNEALKNDLTLAVQHIAALVKKL